ncbi:hypothetical protein EDB89DRAFT_2230923 [Lactarius sanguifluus]|nr:hypothetical protein EDB89DRAFT_2230923 [Lactarius sanguifluus]
MVLCCLTAIFELPVDFYVWGFQPTHTSRSADHDQMTSEQPFKIAVSDNALAILVDDIRLNNELPRLILSSTHRIEHESSESLSIHLTRNWMQPVCGAKASPLVILHVYPTLTISLVGVSESVVQICPCSSLECMNTTTRLIASPLPHPPRQPLEGRLPTLSALTVASDATAVAPYVLSDWERTTYYNGISPDPP